MNELRSGMTTREEIVPVCHKCHGIENAHLRRPGMDRQRLRVEMHGIFYSRKSLEREGL